MKKPLLPITLLILITNTLFAQLPQMQIAGKPKKETTEFVGSNIKDTNGRICAAIKVVSNLDGLKYQSYNGVVKVDDKGIF